jgi:hypothetical protein
LVRPRKSQRSLGLHPACSLQPAPSSLTSRNPQRAHSPFSSILCGYISFSPLIISTFAHYSPRITSHSRSCAPRRPRWVARLMESNQDASRASKRYLDDRVRTDWAYPDVPAIWSASDEEVRDAVELRERYYGESESSDSNNEGGGAAPYKFDSPDSIGDAVAQTRDARKKRRRARLEEEMKGNPGLRIWVERRDQWTGAASVKKYGHRRRATSTAPAAEAHDEPSTSDPSPTLDVVPVAPRILPDNPIRRSITSSTYQEVFQKVVSSSRTPSVPINLSDMTKALVQGWKETDEWPPRAGLLDPLIGKKRGLTGSRPDGRDGAQTGFMDRHPHVGKSVDSVKRIFHLSGGHGEADGRAG